MIDDNTMVPDIDQELENIIDKYNLDRHYPAYRTSREACDYIRKWIETLSDEEETVLFITMDDSVLWMIRGWAGRKKNVNVILLSTVEQLGNNITKLQNANKMYVAAYTRTIEILHWLWRHDFQAESVYDVLENQHIYCQMEFYRFFPPLFISDELELNDMNKEINTDGAASVLYEYYYQTQRLQHSVSEEGGERIKEKLFFLAISMRNFFEAERILRTMLNNGEYGKCWREIEALLDKIKGVLAHKSQNHIIIYWLDALGFENAEKMEYLQEQRSHSLYFHNAFTLTPYTFPTFKNMFFGIRQVDDLGYRINNVELENSPLVQDIIEQGYDYKIVSNYITRHLKSNDHCGYYGRQIKNAPCSEAFWSLTRQVVQSRQPTVYLVHALVELHLPRISIRRNKFEQEYESKPETMQAQFDELNGQLRFYDQMIGDSPYRIYMGDHGLGSVFINRTHVAFQIYHAAWKNKEVSKLFCYLDFPKIMHQLLTDEEIDDATWSRECIPVQDVDYYNPNRLKSSLLQALDMLPSFTAYKGVATSEYIYIYFKTGDEIFHRYTDGAYVPNIGFADSQEDCKLLEELRKKVGAFPKELDTDPKFKYAKNTYKICENLKRTVRETAKLLNKKFALYADGSIVLRPGGFHTIRLCAILSVDNRKKIGGIIDRNPNCTSRCLGYPIYRPEDRLPDDIKAVLLSTCENLETLKHEAVMQYSNLEIIDIYQYWKDCGYAFQKNFWYGLESDWDIEFLKE